MARSRTPTPPLRLGLTTSRPPSLPLMRGVRTKFAAAALASSCVSTDPPSAVAMPSTFSKSMNGDLKCTAIIGRAAVEMGALLSRAPSPSPASLTKTQLMPP